MRTGWGADSQCYGEAFICAAAVAAENFKENSILVISDTGCCEQNNIL